MGHHAPDRIRNVALVGHRGTRQDEPRGGDPLRVRRRQPARKGRGRLDGLRLRARRARARDVDRRRRDLVRARRPQGQHDRHAGRGELRRRGARRAAGRRRRRLRRQRRDGRRGPHRAPLAPGRRGGPLAPRLRQHARSRAGRLLPHARVAAGGVRLARRRDRDPDRLRARGQRRDRPDRHGRLRARGRGPRALEADRDPRRARRPGPGVPREADGRGGRELRRADGALPRGRGDLARRDRRGAEEGGHRRSSVPGHLRRRDQEPRHEPAARGARRGPALAGDARLGERHGRQRRRRRAGRDRARRGRRPGRVRVQDDGRPVHGPDQHAARLLRRPRLRLARPERDPAREGADRPALGARGQGDDADRRARPRRHRRRREAARDARRRRPRAPRTTRSGSRRSTCRRR